MTVANVPTLRFTTDALPASERVAAWSEFFGRGILKIDIDPPSDREFRSDATLRALPGLGLVAGGTTPIRFKRPRHLVEDDDFSLSILLSGKARYASRDRECVAGPGDAVLWGGGEPGSNEALVDCRFIGVRIPNRAIAVAVPGLSASTCQTIPAQTPALQMLRNYLSMTDQAGALATPELQRLAVTHIYDLVGLALGATRDATEVAQGRGMRAARLKAIKDDIAQHLDDESLSVGAIAVRHQVTPRYVQKLFDAEGVTFTEYVMAQRLARAHRMLDDPRHAERTISAIAFEVGFGDLSYFNRTFRRRYGATPTDVRARALSGPAASSLM